MQIGYILMGDKDKLFILLHRNKSISTAQPIEITRRNSPQIKHPTETRYRCFFVVGLIKLTVFWSFFEPQKMINFTLKKSVILIQMKKALIV